MIRSFSALILALWATASAAEEMRLAVTTSFDSSGLADVLLPAIKEDLDLDVQLLVVGTGLAKLAISMPSWFIPKPRKKHSSPRDMARTVARLCTMTLS